MPGFMIEDKVTLMPLHPSYTPKHSVFMIFPLWKTHVIAIFFSIQPKIKYLGVIGSGRLGDG